MRDNTVKLYHTSREIIKKPDVSRGRRNADFGPGFYLSDDIGFCGKWANERKIYINCYTLDLSGLNVKRFDLNGEWFEYIKRNRAGCHDMYAGADAVIGPVANDTLFNTYGIITSGLPENSQALKLLSIGSRYTQVTVKTQAAVSRLEWTRVIKLTHDEIKEYSVLLGKEEAEYQSAFISALKELGLYPDNDE